MHIKEESEVTANDQGPDLLTERIMEAPELLPNVKAEGTVNIPEEMLKLIGPKEKDCLV